MTHSEIVDLFQREQVERDAWWDAQLAKAIKSVDARAKKHEARLIRWTLVNLAWTVALLIALVTRWQ